MNSSLFCAVAASTGNSKTATGEAIFAVLETIMRAVTEGAAVQLIGF
jgi:DNA-binding protein HU-beta